MSEPGKKHAPYPPRYEQRLTLKNGKEVFIRPIRPDDGPLLVALFDHLSARSVHLRFLSDIPSLPDELLHHLTHVDYDREFALAAVVGEGGRDAVIAVTRYALDTDEGFTDLAIAVRDDWQRAGLGTILLGKIVDIGEEHGIRSFRSMMDPGNDVIRHVLNGLGYDVRYTMRDGDYQVDITV